jgi:lambda family phage portal protein
MAFNDDKYLNPRIELTKRRANQSITIGDGPILFDADGREIRAQTGGGAWGGNTGVVVSRANSGFLLGGTGYAQHGASFRRRALAAWLPWAGSADTDIVRNLATLRARSRDLYMSFPVGKAAIETKVNNIVGTGIRPIPAPDAKILGITDDDAIELGKTILDNWRMYMESEACDWERNHNVYSKQAEIYRTKEMAGDAPVLFAYREDGKLPYSLKIRTIDPDRMCNPYQIPVPTVQENVWGGVELNQYNGPLTAYWIARFHPLDYGLLPQITTQRWDRVPVFTDEYLTRNALLHYNIERPQQRRGVPPLATCFELAKGLQRFVNEKIAKEVISNFFSVFVKSPMPTEDIFRQFEPEEIKEFYKVFPYDITMTPGGIVFGKPGDSVDIIKGDAGGSDYSTFSQYNFMIVCAALQVPYSVVMKRFEASYSASRAELEEFYERTVKVERQLHIDQVDQPIYEAFLGELILNKVLKFKKYFKDYSIKKALSRCLWTGIGQGSIDPLKDIQAAMLRVQLGISTVQREAMFANGTDWEDNLAQLDKEKKAYEDLGLTYLAFPGMTNIVREKVGAGEATAGTQVTKTEGEPGTKGEDTGEEPSQAPTPKQSQNV